MEEVRAEVTEVGEMAAERAAVAMVAAVMEEERVETTVEDSEEVETEEAATGAGRAVAGKAVEAKEEAGRAVEVTVAVGTEVEVTEEAVKASRMASTPAPQSRAACAKRQGAPTSGSRLPVETWRCRIGTQTAQLMRAPQGREPRSSPTWQSCSRPQTRPPKAGRASDARTASGCG